MTVLANFFKHILAGGWWLYTLVRSVVLNLLFVILFISFIVVSCSDKAKIEVPKKTALVVNLVGDLVEQKQEINPMDSLVNDFFDQKDDKPEVLISNVVDVIARAKNDDRVQLLVLQLQGLNNSGLSKLQDVGKALVDYKSSGKRIIALGDQYTQDQYYLASYADDVWLNPQGFMLLDGYGRYNMYFKSALEKLAINQHIFRVGTFKSAVEPFLRNDMSEEAKEANKLWLGDLWEQYKQDVARQRGFDTDNFDESIENLLTKFSQSDSSFAQYALANNWVDQLKSRDQMRSQLTELVGENKKGTSYSQIGFKDYLKASTANRAFENQSTDKVAVIVAKGTILNGTQKPGLIGGDSTAKLLRKARMDKKVKAVVLRVDSPGGSAFASEIIRQEIELIKAAGKPVVASMGTYAASGGYWISAPADKIYAAPSTITGSIGIFGMMMTFEDSLSKLGIHTDGVGTTDISSFGPTQPLTDGMSQLFQLSINKGYQDFISLVATNRGMTLEQVDAVAQGRVWSGKKAKELGLVDKLGNLTDAVIAAAELAKLEQYDTLLIEKEPSSRHKLIQQLIGNTSGIFSLGTANSVDLLSASSVTNEPVNIVIKQLHTQLETMKKFNDPQGKYTLCLVCSGQ
ncbi:MAG: signal peptide peptidase SppA [Litorilituus sp.]|jgi:protease-4|nr:signal peptide peptidase SppA [Litorilituus sp.]